MRSQGTRHGLKIKKKTEAKDDTLPPPSTGIDEDEGVIATNLDPSRPNSADEPDIHGRFAEVNEDVASTGFKRVFEDPYAGTFMWIPPGEISIWVPYAEEQRVVKVTQGFWMGNIRLLRRYTSHHGNESKFC